MTAHIPPRQLDKSTPYRMTRETNILRCVNGCGNPRLRPFTTCRVCRLEIWVQGSRKAARSRKRMARAREAAG